MEGFGKEGVAGVDQVGQVVLFNELELLFFVEHEEDSPVDFVEVVEHEGLGSGYLEEGCCLWCL